MDIGHFTDIQHHMDTDNATPIKEILRRTPFGFEEEEKLHLMDLFRKEIIQPSSSISDS